MFIYPLASNMPRKTSRAHHGRRRKRVGGALPAWMSSVGDFLKKHQIISRGANALSGILPGAWGTAAGLAGKAASAVGYGRRRGRGLRTGGALTMAGGALR